MNFSESKFKKFLENLKNLHKIHIRNVDEKVSRFMDKNRSKKIDEIYTNLELCKENDIRVYDFFDKKYPKLLKSIKNPPKFIFIKGEIKLTDYKAVAMIGTRQPTSYGEKMALDIARILSEKGFTIVSGFARGIDIISMSSAVNNGGRAIGILPSGILNIYPPENKEFVEKIVNNGALISEMFPRDNVTVRALQMRNRITSGFGLGNIFVEGTKSSGTKWQLKFGKEQNRISIAVKPIGDYEQGYIPDLIISEEKGEIISSLDDLDYIEELLMSELEVRINNLKGKKKVQKTQTNLFKY